MSTAALLRISALRKTFGGLAAVSDLDFAVHAGEVLGLLGPKGSGKTTVINLISGALSPDAGEILLAGQSIAGMDSYRAAQAGVARTFQLVRVLREMTALENVAASLAFGRHPRWGIRATARARSLLGRVGLTDQADTRAAELAYADRKRLELARALALEPRLLLLDEWLGGVEPSELQAGISLIRSLKEEGMAIILSEQVMEAVHALCDRCVVLNRGAKIAEGSVGMVFSDITVVRTCLKKNAVA
ncbi:MAG: ATP-binding cassette domain-containing protein [Pigmentiphaga sp.]|uniref:ABC transporter ATP-binding protein n=1 Tax=Pigmentiphaga sp. TaxID=1977564 RepID=UPI0029A015CE|nr:ATP-binding cassette domain-containing protein [Pigmentiphaga sp.]MDX3907920.1 ATP-binding cassette domain-containing protein [Pigmentiphaga sp.]